VGKLEADWNEYIEEYNSLYHYGRSGKRRLNNSTDPEDTPAPPSMDALEIILFDDDGYQPDCPWKTYDFNEDNLSRGNLNRVSKRNNDDLDVYGNHSKCKGKIECSKLI
jgi:hypothetical protein